MGMQASSWEEIHSEAPRKGLCPTLPLGFDKKYQIFSFLSLTYLNIFPNNIQFYAFN